MFSEQSLQNLFKASMIDVPTFTSIFYGYKRAEADAANREKAAILKREERLKRDNAFDIKTFASDVKLEADKRAMAERQFATDRTDIRSDATQQRADIRQTASAQTQEVLQEDRQQAAIDAAIERAKQADKEIEKRYKNQLDIEKEKQKNRLALEKEKARIRSESPTKKTAANKSFLSAFGTVGNTPVTNSVTPTTTNAPAPLKQSNTSQSTGATTPNTGVVTTKSNPNIINRNLPVEPTKPDLNRKIDAYTYGLVSGIANSEEAKKAGIDSNILINAILTSPKDNLNGKGLFGVTEEEALQKGFTKEQFNKNDDAANIIGADKVKAILNGIDPKADTETKLNALINNGIIDGEKLKQQPDFKDFKYSPIIDKQTSIDKIKADVINSPVDNLSPEVQKALDNLNQPIPPMSDDEAIAKAEEVRNSLIEAGIEPDVLNDESYASYFDNYLSGERV